MDDRIIDWKDTHSRVTISLMIKPIGIKTIGHHLKDPVYTKALFVSLTLLVASLVINFFAGRYATADASNPVTDIVLSNIPVFDIDSIFVYGAFVLVAIIAFLCFFYPRRAPFILKAISLFTIIRAIFVNLTHLGPFPTQVAIDPLSLINNFTFGGDLFFSGHTGLPFLMALLFWDNKTLRTFFIAVSVTFGVVVLMGHLHYSIDVLAAFFITYSIYHLSERLFKKDKLMADESSHHMLAQ